jgi:hypothetical protein
MWNEECGMAEEWLRMKAVKKCGIRNVEFTMWMED